MTTETQVTTSMPRQKDPGQRVEETWTVLTYEAEQEWWSEVLDGAHHPSIHTDEFGFDTVRKFYGDTLKESRDAALKALHDLVRERGGEVKSTVEGKRS